MQFEETIGQVHIICIPEEKEGKTFHYRSQKKYVENEDNLPKITMMSSCNM